MIDWKMLVEIMYEHQRAYLLLDFEFPCSNNGPLDIVNGEFKLEFRYCIHVQQNANIGVLRGPCLFKEFCNLMMINGAFKAKVTERTSPSRVFSSLPLTIRAETSLSDVTSLQLMIGVLMTLAALMISFIRGTPSVTFIEATPAKWKVLRVICVPGSPIDCAPTAPTVEPIEIFREDREIDKATDLARYGP